MTYNKLNAYKTPRSLDHNICMKGPYKEFYKHKGNKK